MTLLLVDGIRLSFDDSWRVARWDDERWYRDGICKLTGDLEGVPQGSKAVDAIGVWQDDTPFLLEVKDFRGFSIENKQRQMKELPLEIGLKARDTIAGLVGIVVHKKENDLPSRWIGAVRAQKRPVHVFALIAEDEVRPGEAVHKRDARASERGSRLKQRLAWLTPRVQVADPLRDRERLKRFGVAATSAAGAGPARPR